MQYEIKNRDNLKDKCEKALKDVSKRGNLSNLSNNYFPIKREKLNNIIEQWQKKYPKLYDELEGWKKEPKLQYKTVALFCEGSKMECVFLEIYDSGNSDSLDCISISRTYTTYTNPSMISKLLNKIFKHNSQNKFKKLAEKQPAALAALILSGDNGLRIIWEE
ncbi:hypothetical protein RclHR1_04280002 [Rhizophagus clarus]|nr:hypothetical protein RclHR1_04280002 [Rhizophagus clarus]